MFNLLNADKISKLNKKLIWLVRENVKIIFSFIKRSNSNVTLLFDSFLLFITNRKLIKFTI